MHEIVRTNGGFIIENFEILEEPIPKFSGPHIYGGLVKDVPIADHKEDFYITWDENGRCSNKSRKDCFIDVSFLSFKLQFNSSINIDFS